MKKKNKKKTVEIKNLQEVKRIGDSQKVGRKTKHYIQTD